MIWFWIARINGHEYVYYKTKMDGYRTHYFAPLHVAARMICRGVNRATAQISAKVGATFDEAKAMARALKNLIETYKERLKGSYSSYDAMFTDAVVLEALQHGRSEIMHTLLRALGTFMYALAEIIGYDKADELWADYYKTLHNRLLELAGEKESG